MERDEKLILCPYCGHPQHGGDRCVSCGGLFDSLSLKATQVAMGPWYVRDKDNPFRPGCSYETLVKQVKAGKVKPTTVLRGPSTRQFWQVARNVPGVAHLLGYCHSCNNHVQPTESRCPSCASPFVPVKERNELGLMFPNETAVTTAKQMLERELASAASSGAAGGAGVTAAEARRADAGSRRRSGERTGDGAAAAMGADLLRDVLGTAPASTRTAPPKQKAASATDAAHEAGAADRFNSAITTSMSASGRATSATVPSAPPRQQARALDFGPSDDATEGRDGAGLGSGGRDAQQIDALEQRNRKLSTMTWVLVAFNILVLIGVAFLIWYYTRNPALPGSTAKPSVNPMVAAASPELRTALATPAPKPDAAVSLFESDPPIRAVEPSMRVDLSPAPEVEPNTVAPVGTAAAEAQRQTRQFAAELAKARQLEQAGNLKQSLATLQALLKDNPQGHETELRKDIDRLRRLITQQERQPATFFGMPVP
ncbi:MAG: hypothetical protein WD042_16835 [Phycisphaeraceae bacterium]